jgi:hypothetical protein
MLYMVIERFKKRDLGRIGERFTRRGRLLPEGLNYQTSWVDATGTRCFQVMETRDPELFKQWTGNWADLIDFEIVPVVASSEFWTKKQ